MEKLGNPLVGGVTSPLNSEPTLGRLRDLRYRKSQEY